MGLFGFSEKKTTSSTQNTTTNNYTDQSANAGGDNSSVLSATNGASVVINDLSEGVAKAALDANSKNSEFFANTLVGLSESAARNTNDTRAAADLAIRSNQGLTTQLKDLTEKAIDRAQTPDGTLIQKILIPIVGAFVVLGAIVLINRKRKGGK